MNGHFIEIEFTLETFADYHELRSDKGAMRVSARGVTKNWDYTNTLNYMLSSILPPFENRHFYLAVFLKNVDGTVGFEYSLPEDLGAGAEEKLELRVFYRGRDLSDEKPLFVNCAKMLAHTDRPDIVWFLEAHLRNDVLRRISQFLDPRLDVYIILMMVGLFGRIVIAWHKRLGDIFLCM